LDNEVRDVPEGGTNKDKPEGNKKAKEKLRKQAEASSFGQKMMTW
jgi:hypothetical protein